MNPKRRSRNSFGMHLVATSALATLTFAAVIAVSIFAPVFSHLDQKGLSTEEMAGAAEHLLFLHVGFWPVVAISLLSAIASALVLFTRMAAPLVRFVRVFEAVGHGLAPGPLVIREGDYLQEEAAALNRMTEALGQRQRALARQVLELRDAVEALEESEEKLGPDASEPIARLRARLLELERLAEPDA